MTPRMIKLPHNDEWLEISKIFEIKVGSPAHGEGYSLCIRLHIEDASKAHWSFYPNREIAMEVAQAVANEFNALYWEQS